MTTVSVVMCTYNGAQYLSEQLDSIASQTRLPDELIIVDDASSDGTVDLIREYTRTSPLNIRFHRNPANIGYKMNFLKALALGNGDLLFLSDQDDVWEADKIEIYTQHFEDPACQVVYSDSSLVDQNLFPLGKTLWQSIGLSPQEQEAMQGETGFRIAFRRGNIFCGCSMAMTRAFRDKALPYPESVPHDLWLGNLASALGGLRLINQPLMKYRQHKNQTSGDKTPTMRNLFLKWRRGAVMFSDTRYYDRWIDEHTSLRERLAVLGKSPSEAVKLLDQKITYLKSQKVIHSRNRIARIPHVIVQVASGRHRKFGHGLKSLAVDLLM